MPAHIITLEQYGALLSSFREAPGHLARACKAAGVSAVTAKRYWTTGHPEAPDERAQAICEVIAREQVEARARMQALDDKANALAIELESRRRADAQAKAMGDATDTRVAEAQLIRMARGSTMAVLASVTNISKGVAKVAVRVAKSLEAVAQDPAPMDMGQVSNTVRTLTAMASALRQVNDAGRQVMEMERLLLGEPTSITAHMHLSDVTMDEAERRLAAGQRALDRAKARGLVVEGKVAPHSAALSPGTPGTASASPSPARTSNEGDVGAPLLGVPLH